MGTKADLHEARAVPEIEAKGWADVNGMIGGPTRAYLLLIPHHIPPDLDQDWHTTGDSRSTFCVGYGLGSPLRGIVIPGPNLLLATDLETSRETQWVFSRTVPPPPKRGNTERYQTTQRTAWTVWPSAQCGQVTSPKAALRRVGPIYWLRAGPQPGPPEAHAEP